MGINPSAKFYAGISAASIASSLSSGYAWSFSKASQRVRSVTPPAAATPSSSQSTQVNVHATHRSSTTRPRSASQSTSAGDPVQAPPALPRARPLAPSSARNSPLPPSRPCKIRASRRRSRASTRSSSASARAAKGATRSATTARRARTASWRNGRRRTRACGR